MSKEGKVSGLDTPALRDQSSDSFAEPNETTSQKEAPKPSRLEIILSIEDELRSVLQNLEKEDEEFNKQIKFLEDRVQRLKDRSNSKK